MTTRWYYKWKSTNIENRLLALLLSLSGGCLSKMYHTLKENKAPLPVSSLKGFLLFNAYKFSKLEYFSKTENLNTLETFSFRIVPLSKHQTLTFKVMTFSLWVKNNCFSFRSVVVLNQSISHFHDEGKLISTASKTTANYIVNLLPPQQVSCLWSSLDCKVVLKIKCFNTVWNLFRIKIKYRYTNKKNLLHRILLTEFH